MAYMIKVKEEEYSLLLPYLEEDISNCVYIYMNLINGAKENADMEVWIQGTGESPELVLMRYYESFRVYGREMTLDLEPVVAIMERYIPEMISGQENVIKTLEGMMGDVYRTEYGGVYEINALSRLKRICDVALAEEGDSSEIAKLIAIDRSLGGHYSMEKLEKQIRNRIKSGTGRSYIIRETGKIIAHTATYAETTKYAVVSGTIIHPEYRDSGLYPVISSHIAQELKEEGKTVYTFAVDPRMITYHDKMDFRCGNYGRLVLK